MPAARIPVKVFPRSATDSLAGWAAGELAVRVRAAPEQGKANAAACALVAGALGVPKGSVRVVRGDAARHKLLEAAGVDEGEVRARLGGP